MSGAAGSGEGQGGPGPGDGELGLAQRAGLGLIHLYQRGLSPVLGGGCRFYPSCSEYARMVIEADGLWRGGIRAVRRIARCTPLQAGGLDLP